MSFSREFSTYPTPDGQVQGDDWNALLDHGLQSYLDYVVYKSSTYWYAKDGATGKRYFGDGNGVSGCIQDCFDAGAHSVGIKYGINPTFDEKLTISTSDARLYGLGWATMTAKNALNDHMIELTGDRIHLSGIGLDGNESNQTGTCHGIYNHGNNNVIHDFNIQNALSDGIHCGESTWNSDSMGGKLSNGRISSCGRYGLAMDYSATDYELDHMLINTMSGSGDAGIWADGDNNRYSNMHLWGNYYNLVLAPAHSVSGLDFENIGFKDNINHLVYKNSSVSLRDCTFTGCSFWGKLSSGSAVRDCFYVSSSGSMYSCAVVGCAFRGDNESATKQGRYAINWGSNVDYCTFVGNTVRAFTESSPVQILGTGNIHTDLNAYYNNGT